MRGDRAVVGAAEGGGSRQDGPSGRAEARALFAERRPHRGPRARSGDRGDARSGTMSRRRQEGRAHRAPSAVEVSASPRANATRARPPGPAGTWIGFARQVFEHEAHNRVLVDCVQAVESATARVERLTKDIVELVESWSLRPLVKALQALRGVQIITAVDPRRGARRLRAICFGAGLDGVPRHRPFGALERGDAKARAHHAHGQQHVRRILVESAWSYRHRPTMSSEIRKRNKGVAPGVQAIAWKAQERLHGRYKKLLGRGKNKQQTVTALARELAGFVWSIARQPQLLAN